MTSPPNLQERVNAALASVRNNRLGINVLEAEMVRDVATTLDGKVRFTILLAPSDDARLVREVRQVVEQVDGVREVRVDVKDGGAGSACQLPKQKPRSLPVMGQEPLRKRAAVPAPTPVTYPNLGNIIAISSGKGGVGKSTVASNLAIALAAAGRTRRTDGRRHLWAQHPADDGSRTRRRSSKTRRSFRSRRTA